jgi:hypothetical protein
MYRPILSKQKLSNLKFNIKHRTLQEDSANNMTLIDDVYVSNITAINIRKMNVSKADPTLVMPDILCAPYHFVQMGDDLCEIDQDMKKRMRAWRKTKL